LITSILQTVWEGLQNAFLMAWQVWWALVLGFALSGIVQAWIPRARVERALGGSGARPVSLATALGAASSSCSYAAIAIARSLFAAGASAASALAFQFASTNLVLELGLLLWVLLGWQFMLAELLGGLVLIALATLMLRAFIPRRLEEEARLHARAAEAGHQHHSAGAEMTLRRRLSSLDAWSDVAHNFRNDWAMLYREIATGLLLAGFIGLLGDGFFNGLFLTGSAGPVRLLENVLVGPLIAVLSFVCSVGNIPLAAVLWSGGIGFAGVIAFIFADLIVLPIVVIYRKYYGGPFALRLVALMLVAMILAALAVAGLFALFGLTPSSHPSRAAVFGSIGVDYKLFANAAALVLFAGLFALTALRGATDPVCGMKIDRRRAIAVRHEGRTVFVCSEGCAGRLTAAEDQADPDPPERASSAVAR